MISSEVSVTYNATEILPVVSNDFNITITNQTSSDGETLDDNFVLHYGILPLGLVAIILLLFAVVAFLIRKKRLDKLRHHLMPLYSFDPTEEGEDWEAELLEEGTDHNPRGKNSRPDQPQLSFHGNL